MPPPRTPPPEPAAPAGPLWPRTLPLLLAAAFALTLVATLPFPAPDELEHLSYAAILQETGRWLPRFETHLDLYRNDLRLWSDRVNYIGHPSPYYLWIGQFLDRDLPLEQAVTRVRLASLALLLAGTAIATAAALRSPQPFRGLAAWTFAAGIAWCPQSLTVASQLNNDALAVLAGGLAYAGVLRGTPPLAALGLALALWAKPNAGLEVGLFTGLAWLLTPARSWPAPSLPARSWRSLAWLVAGGIVGLLPILPILLRYGSLVPVAAETVWPVRSMPGFAEYWPVFLANIGQSWGWMTFGHWPMDTWDLLRSLACWAMLATCVLGGIQALRSRTDPGARLAAAAALAFCLVLPLHLGFAAARLGHSVPAAAFRYYLALWPGLLHALCRAADTSPRLRPAILAIAAAAFLLGWLA